MHAKLEPKQISFPMPSPSAAGRENAVVSGEPVELTLRNGLEITGGLRDFNLELGIIFVAVERQPAPRAIGIEELKSMRLPKMRIWLTAPGENAERRGFTLRFKDGDILEGITAGQHQDMWGLYLFPSDQPNLFSSLFIPQDFIESFTLGEHFAVGSAVRDIWAPEAAIKSLDEVAREQAGERYEAFEYRPEPKSAAPEPQGFDLVDDLPPWEPVVAAPTPKPVKPIWEVEDEADHSQPFGGLIADEEFLRTLHQGAAPPPAAAPAPQPPPAEGFIGLEIHPELLEGIHIDDAAAEPLFSLPEPTGPATELPFTLPEPPPAEPSAAPEPLPALTARPEPPALTAKPEPPTPPRAVSRPAPAPKAAPPPAPKSLAPAAPARSATPEPLRSHAVATSLELEKALERQKSAPNLKLGEILIGEGLITPLQLDDALAAQKLNRKVPLGEILIQRGVVSTTDIQQALARKLNIPFVDVTHFDLDYEAVEMVPAEMARKFRILPLYLYKDKLVIAVENPMAWEPLDAVRFHTKKFVEPVMASAEDLDKAINAAYSPAGLDRMSLEEYEVSSDEDFEDELVDEASVSDNVVVKLVNKIIYDAYQKGASDIHIEPYGHQKTLVRIRRDGTLVPFFEVPAKMRAAVIARIKVMANLDLSERRKPQDGKIDFKKFGGAKIELRVATLPTAGGMEDVVMRILASSEPLPIEKLGLTDRNRAELVDLMKKPYGLFFVCGPTGSGKTTTLHSLLKYLNNGETKIWTAEDPVEITQAGLRQVQINPKVGLTFAAAMRSFLRADPDVIMVGEMRDQETTKIAIEASLTGHLVLATLHTNSAPESITRLLDMGMDPFNFADALIGVLAQRLTKRLCAECKESYHPDEHEVADLIREYCLELVQEGVDRDEVHAEVLADWERRYADDQGRFTLCRPKGCDRCGDSGYRGRVGVHELLTASPFIKKQIIEEAPVYQLTATALKEGMRTLKQDGIEKVLQGLTDIHQVRKVCIK